MLKLLLSEWLRTKRTAVRWLTFCMPIIFSLCTAAYLAAREGSTQAFAFEGFFTIWTVFIIPAGIGILAGFIVQEEELAGNFSGYLGTGLSRVRLYAGKFLLLFFLCGRVYIYRSIDPLRGNEGRGAGRSYRLGVCGRRRSCSHWSPSAACTSPVDQLRLGDGSLCRHQFWRSFNGGNTWPDRPWFRAVAVHSMDLAGQAGDARGHLFPERCRLPFADRNYIRLDKNGIHRTRRCSSWSDSVLDRRDDMV